MAKYVRLPDRLLSGNVTDVLGGSGWSISGLDVKEVPSEEDEPEAFNFVTALLRAGTLEEASAAEYKLITNAIKEVEKVARVSLPESLGGPAQPSPWNEAAIANVANKHRKKLVGARIANSFEQAEEDNEGGEGEPNYAGLHKAELQSLARDRGLDSSGNMDDLVARLEEDDRNKANA